MKIDLHDLTTNDALRIFIQKYNEEYKKGNRNRIEIIHGYGSGGSGGKIKKELHKFLKANNKYLKFELGLNPGALYVLPKKKLPEYQDSLEEKILIFCKENPKSLSKIERKFLKNYNIKEIKSIVNKLVKTKKLDFINCKSTITYRTK